MGAYEEDAEYHYDIGYYEGIRNILQIIIKNLSIADLSEEKKVKLLLKDVEKELDHAKEEMKYTEKRHFGYNALY
jgi:hypothetical protein